MPKTQPTDLSHIMWLQSEVNNSSATSGCYRRVYSKPDSRRPFSPLCRAIGSLKGGGLRYASTDADLMPHVRGATRHFLAPAMVEPISTLPTICCEQREAEAVEYIRTRKLEGIFSFSSHFKFTIIPSFLCSQLTHLNIASLQGKVHPHQIKMSTSTKPKHTFLVLGATGGCGLNFIIKSLKEGHSISARKFPTLLRRPPLTSSSGPHSRQTHHHAQRKQARGL